MDVNVDITVYSVVMTKLRVIPNKLLGHDELYTVINT